MRKLIIFFAAIITILSCKKECEINIDDVSFFHKDYFNVYYCPGYVENGIYKNWETIHYSYVDFIENENCNWDVPIVVPLDFNGIIISKGVLYTDFYNHKQTISIIKNDCEKVIYYNMKIEQLDNTSLIAEGQVSAESVVSVLDSIPSDFTVEFSTEIIPYKE